VRPAIFCVCMCVCVGGLVGWWVGVVGPMFAMRPWTPCESQVVRAFLAELHSSSATTNAMETPRLPISTHFGPTSPLRQTSGVALAMLRWSET
jgi:hypothetical protein